MRGVMAEPLGRIALLTGYYSSEQAGGVEVFNQQLGQVLGGLEIIADRVGPEEGPVPHLTRFGLEEPYRAIRVARSFTQAHRANPFRLVITNGIYGWPLAIRRMNVPAIQVYHFTMAGLARQALVTRGDRLATGRVSAFFDRLAGRGKIVVAVSDSVRREAGRHYGLGARVIPNSVDTSLFRPLDRARARGELGLPAEATIGLFVGRAEYAKGFDVFLEVARQMPDILFVHVGSGEPREPNVRAVLRVPHTEMPRYYSAADFLFLPSRYEGFNLSILEALACGLPIVVSQAAYPFVEDPASLGFVARTFAPRAFVEGIRSVLGARSTFAPRESVVERYSMETFGNAWRGLARALLEDA